MSHPKKSIIRQLLFCLALTFSAVLLPCSTYSAQLGDGGHFIAQFQPEIFLNNPDGKTFSATVHRYIWPYARFNADFRCSLTAPDGRLVAETPFPKDQGTITLNAPSGPKGVYKLNVRMGGYGLCWVESTLDQMVTACKPIGPLAEGAPNYEVLMLHSMVPRRWYFYVPEGVARFRVKTAIGTWMTRREDFGVQVISPRGQRVKALYGGLSLFDAKPQGKSLIISQEVEADPGTQGRFWSLWVTGGDSHNYSDFRIILEGVPPYVAPTPEQWFDPSTGEAPPKLIYDTSAIRLPKYQAKDGKPDKNAKPGDYYNWAPAPYLGDEDYNGIRGKATVLIWNPDNREIEFGAGSYVFPDPAGMPVKYALTDPAGQHLFSVNKTFVHGTEYSVVIPPHGGGVYRMQVEADSWYAWTVPAVPIMLEGIPSPGGHTFRFQIGTPRHWYFNVPTGTEKFDISVKVDNPDHVLSLEVHAPDRLVRPMYVSGDAPQTLTITVPQGLDGHVWFLRTAVGSATRFISEDPTNPIQVRIDTDITLKGVPGYLAPTWSQWFAPENE